MKTSLNHKKYRNLESLSGTPLDFWTLWAFAEIAAATLDIGHSIG